MSSRSSERQREKDCQWNRENDQIAGAWEATLIKDRFGLHKIRKVDKVMTVTMSGKAP